MKTYVVQSPRGNLKHRTTILQLFLLLLPSPPLVQLLRIHDPHPLCFLPSFQHGQQSSKSALECISVDVEHLQRGDFGARVVADEKERSVERGESFDGAGETGAEDVFGECSGRAEVEVIARVRHPSSIPLRRVFLYHCWILNVSFPLPERWRDEKRTDMRILPRLIRSGSATTICSENDIAVANFRQEIVIPLPRLNIHRKEAPSTRSRTIRYPSGTRTGLPSLVDNFPNQSTVLQFFPAALESLLRR